MIGARTRRTALAFAILAALVAFAYGRATRGGFVFDDHELVEGNPLVRESPVRPGSLLWQEGEAAGFAYRPVRVLSYQVDHLVAGGLDPRVFHLSNVIWHLATTLALFLFARSMIGSDEAALVAAATFAVHPLGSEAVAYVSGRRDLLCAFFGIAALGAWWWRIAGGGGPVAVAGSLACGLLALGAKETAVVLPLLAWLATFVRPPGGSRTDAPARAWRGVLLGVAAAVLGAATLYRERIGPVLARAASSPIARQPALTLRVLGRYLRLAVLPDELQADYRAGAFELPRQALEARTLAAGLAVSGIGALGILLLRRGAVAGLGLLWFLVALVPVAQVVPYAEVVAEHNAYLPLAGLALALGDGFARVVRLSGRRGRAAAGLAAAALACAFALRTRARVEDWRDEETLWRATLDVAPDSVRALHNLGATLASRGRPAAALEPLERAHRAAPGDADVRRTLARVLTDTGDGPRAVEVARPLVVDPGDGESWNVLGFAQVAAGDPAAARASFERARALGAVAEADEGLRALDRRGGRP
ncbi:tetratricopeptide repeat protein [bacterium]|nr:tetratricopeptide repeat protein [bacterium]